MVKNLEIRGEKNCSIFRICSFSVRILKKIEKVRKGLERNDFKSHFKFNRENYFQYYFQNYSELKIKAIGKKSLLYVQICLISF